MGCSCHVFEKHADKMSSSTETTQNRQVLQGLPSEREAAFIALRFLSQFHCDESVQRLAEDLGKRHLLPVEYDWKGNMKTVSFEELSKLYPHIDENFLTTALGYALPGEPNPVTTLLQVSHGNRAKKNKRRTQSCIRLLLERATERAMMGTDSWPTSFLYKNIKRLKTLVGHMKPVYCIAFDSFSNYLVTGADDQLIKVWSVETGYLLHTLKFHEGEITDLAIHPWRPVLVSASNDSSLCVWDLPSGLLLCVLKGHSRGSSAVTFCRNPERPFLASGGSDGCVLLWNIDHPEYGPVRESLINIQSGTRRNGDEDELDDDFVPFDEQRDHVEDNTSDDNRMEVQDSSNAEPISPEQNSSDGEGTDQYLQILSLDFNNAGTLLAVGAANNRAYLYNLTMNEANLFQMEHLATLKGHTGAVYHVRFSHRGERLASGGTDGRAKIWRRKNIQGTQWSSLVLSMRQEHTGRSSREMVRNRRVNEPPRVTSLVWSLDDKFVITASSDCKIRVWNSTTGDLLHCLTEHQDHIYVLDTHPFDRRVILSADHNSLIILWDIEQGKVLKEFNLASPEMSSYASFPFHHRSLDGCFSPNGLLFAISDESGALILFGHGNGENLALAPQQQFFVHDLQSEQLHTFEERERRAKLPTRSLLCDMRGVKYPLSMQPLHIFRQHTYESRNLVEQERAHSDLVARAEASRRLELEEQERIAREERARARAAAIARLRREMNDSESENDEADSAENIRQRLRKRVSRKHSVIEYSFSESSESSSDPEMTYSTSDYSTSDDTLEGSNCDESEHSDVEDDVWMDSESSVSDASSPNREGIHYLRSSMKRTKNRGSKSNASRHRNGRDISKATSSTQSKISIRRKLKRSDWLRALSNDWSVYEYVPQIDDEVYYFPKGHLDFIRAEGIGQNHYVELVEYFHDEERPKKLKICSVDYIIVQRRKPCIVARLQVVPLGGTSSGKFQNIFLALY